MKLKRNRLYRFLCLLIIWESLISLPVASAGEGKNRLSDIRYWSSPTFTRLVLDLKDETQCNSFILKEPERIVIELNDFDGYMPKTLLNINDGIVKNVRALQDKEGKIRMIIDLEKPAAHKIFPLKQVDEKMPRLVIDITRLDLEQADRMQREETRKQKKQGDYIVVVDPGHGGEDPGAVSKRGTQEKDVVLDMGKQLVAQLNRIPGLKTYLTRKGDYFIPLQNRIEIAKEYGADIFISVHANAGFSKKVCGSSVYCLSFKGASSNAATMAAQRENASDVVGGVPLDQKGTNVNLIVCDLVQTHTLNSSVQLAEQLLSEISKINKLYTPTPQQANFAVLRSLDIPSVLIETDFISNPDRERQLKSMAFQIEFAKTTAGTVKEFLFSSNKKEERTDRTYQTAQKNDAQSQPIKEPAAPPASVNGARDKKREGTAEAGSPVQRKVEPSRPDGKQKNGVEISESIPSAIKQQSESGGGTYKIVKKNETEYALVLDRKPHNESPDVSPAGSQKKESERTDDKKQKPSLSRQTEAGVQNQPVHTAPAYHVVQKGETLFSISKLYNMPVDELKKINSMATNADLKSGTKIRVVKRDEQKNGVHN